MSIKALVLDVDNTLYDHASASIPKKHLEAVQALRNQGIKIFLCTGRPYALLENLMEIHPGDYDGLVTGSGCAAYDQNLQPLYDITFEPETLQQLYDLAREKDLPIFCGGKTLCLSRETPMTRHMMEILGIHDVPVRDPEKGERFSLVEFLADPVMTSFPEAEAIEGVKVLYFKDFTDANPEGISKVTGIHALMQHYGLEPTAYMAFGDSVNDLEMLQDAECGIAMGNAAEEIKNVADAVTDSVSDAGIYTYLKKEGWI